MKGARSDEESGQTPIIGRGMKVLAQSSIESRVSRAQRFVAKF